LNFDYKRSAITLYYNNSFPSFPEKTHLICNQENSLRSRYLGDTVDVVSCIKI